MHPNLTKRDAPVFFMRRSDRLIARLRHMFYGIRFAGQVGAPLIMVWSPLPTFSQQFDGTDYHLDHIFNIREHYANGGARQLVLYDSVTPFPPDLPNLEGAEFASMRPANFDRHYFLSERPVVYSGRYDPYQFADEQKSREQLNAEVRTIYTGLPHNTVVARILATAREKLDCEDYAILHVRRGDVGEMLRRDIPLLAAGTLDRRQLKLTLGHYLARTAPFSFYYPEIERCLEAGMRIVFTSDSPETLAHFTKKFGPKPFVDINKYVRARVPIQKAFLDFNMMIGAKRIISTGSTYATFAATLGDCELVNVARNGDIEQFEEFLIQEYAPDLAANLSFRRILLEEMKDVQVS